MFRRLLKSVIQQSRKPPCNSVGLIAEIWRWGKDRTFSNKHYPRHSGSVPCVRPVSLSSGVQKEDCGEARATKTHRMITTQWSDPLREDGICFLKDIRFLYDESSMKRSLVSKQHSYIPFNLRVTLFGKSFHRRKEAQCIQHQLQLNLYH